MMETATAAIRRQQQPEKGENDGFVVLRCFDGVKIAVPAHLARQRSGLVLEAAAAGERVVQVPGNTSGCVVAKVVAYWEARAAVTVMGSFDSAFLGGLQHDERVDLIRAAHHLRDAALFDLFRFGPA